MENKSIQDRVSEIIVDILPQMSPKRIMPQAHLISDLGMDSLDTLELIMGCEAEFEMEITDEEVAGIRTVGDVIKFLESKGVK